MARFVYEIMNKEVFSVTPETPVREALAHILALGVSGAPVIGKDAVPLGLVSVKDLAGDQQAAAVSEVMTTPAVVVEADALIQDAAHLLGETGLHRLVVVDRAWKAVGIVSTLDVIRGLIGMPASHPSTFPHFDRETGLVWTDDAPFDLERVLDSAPDGPGVFALVRGGAFIPETIVWAESAENVKSRLIELASTPQAQPVARWLSLGGLRFRTAAVLGRREREEALRKIAPRSHLTEPHG